MTEFLLPALLATALAGLVRGFTGFGGALVMAPVLLTVIDPISTTAIVIIVNVVAGILQAREIHREADSAYGRSTSSISSGYVRSSARSSFWRRLPCCCVGDFPSPSDNGWAQ